MMRLKNNNLVIFIHQHQIAELNLLAFQIFNCLSQNTRISILNLQYNSRSLLKSLQ